MKKLISSLLLILAFLLLASCSNDAQKNEPAKNDNKIGVIEKTQHDIAQDAVKGMKDPIDKAKAVTAGEDARNKNFKKDSEN